MPLKTKVVPTAMGDLTVSSLSLGELRQLDELFAQSADSNLPKNITSMFRFLPIIAISVRKVHQDVAIEDLEAKLVLEDFQPLFEAVLEVSGLKKAQTTGEALTPVQAV